jgi:hypothetical protein
VVIGPHGVADAGVPGRRVGVLDDAGVQIGACRADRGVVMEEVWHRISAL